MTSLDNLISLTIRPIEPRDAGEVTLLISQLGYERTLEEVLDWIFGLASGGHEQAAYVACIARETDRQDIVGWIEVSIENRLQSPRSALIGGLVVKAGLRGFGIGRRLCQAAESWSWRKHVDALRVTSRSTRADAHRFYLREGYREVKTSLVFEKQRPSPSSVEVDDCSSLPG